MIKEVHTLAPTMTWKQAAEYLMEWGVSAAPVIDDHGKLIGIVSEKDLFRGLFPSYGAWIKHPEAYLDFEELEREQVKDVANRTIEEVMSKELITTGPETPVLQIGALMVARHIHQVPVVHHEKIIGMVKRGKIYNEILKRYFEITR